jgi:hypothetical protein
MPVALDTYLNDLTGNHGRSNWLILLSYQRHYSGEQGAIQQRTNQDGFAEFVIPWNATEEGARFATPIRETPDGVDQNDSTFPSYLDGWSPEWTLHRGTFHYVYIAIQQPHTTWTLTSP